MPNSPKASPATIRTRIAALALLLASGSFAFDLSRFAGTWKLDPTRSSDIRKAVDACVANYPPEAKEASRDRLLEVGANVSKFVITPMDKGSKVVIGYGGPDGKAVALDSSEVEIQTDEGGPVKMRVSTDSDNLVETYQAPDGRSVNTFSVSKDGKTLFMDVRVESPHMPNTLTYRLTYSRN